MVDSAKSGEPSRQRCLPLPLGCNSEHRPQPIVTAPAPQGASMSEDSEMNEAMAKLSPADRTLAEAQKVCPVNGAPLGSMGTPIKVAVEGREIFVCCEGCVEELKSDFSKYAAKLDQQT